MDRDFLQVVNHQAADHPGDQCAEKTGAKTVADPRANGARGQRRAVRNGVADIGRQKRHHQGQSGDANIKQFFQVGIRRAIGHGAFAV